MQKPRLIYYNDAHHFHGKRIEPPVSIHMLQWPVDEVAGTGVDLLVLGLGYGDVYFHNSKVGRVIGQKKEVWENYIDWRIMRMVEEAAKLDTDPAHRSTEPGVVGRHYLHPDASRFSIPGGDHGLGDAYGPLLAPVEHPGQRFLCRGPVGGSGQVR
jgi:hypothetical protein